MIFPPTPENERKSASDKNKFSKKKKKRMTNAGDEDLLSDHRTYETIEELRTRLMQNYVEAKQQREKYLNLKEKKTKEEMEEKSLNGKRNKMQSKTVFKNYKKYSLNKGSRKEPNDLSVGKKGPSIAINGPLNSSDPGSFDNELASALKKRKESLSDMSKKALTDRNNFSPTENHKNSTEESVNGLSITRNYSTPLLGTTKTKFSHNNSSREDDLNLNIKGTEIKYSDINLNHSYSSSIISSDSKSSLAYSTDSTRTSPGPEEALKRKNSSKRRKKSTDKRAGSIKRKNSNRAKSSSLSPSTNDISLLNKENAVDEPKDKVIFSLGPLI